MIKYDLDDMVKKAMSDKQNETHTVVQLTCCGSSIEVTKRQDQYLVCPNPNCMKRHVLLWSLNPKLRSEVDNDTLDRNFR